MWQRNLARLCPFCRWECPMILKWQSKKARQKCAWGRPCSGAERRILSFVFLGVGKGSLQSGRAAGIPLIFFSFGDILKVLPVLAVFLDCFVHTAMPEL